MPQVEYTEDEHEVWRTVCRELRPSTSATPAASTCEAAAALGLPDRPRAAARRGHRPAAAADRLRATTRPPGSSRCASSTARSADRVFHSTQYVRHHSMPLYTPEPDVIHEVIGHGNMLASPRFAAIKRRPPARPPSASRPTRRCSSSPTSSGSRWSSASLREDGELRAYGAGILSSYGEIEEFRGVEIRPLDFAAMGTHRLRHHPLPAGAVRGRLDGPPGGVVGGFFADVRRRHARALAKCGARRLSRSRE